MVSVWCISRMVLNFLSEFFLLMQKLYRMVMFNFCILKKWLIFFLWYFTIIALWWKVYFIVAVFCKNWVLYYGLSWSLKNTLCCWRQQCVLQLFGSITVCLQSSSFFFNFTWSPFCPLFPFSSARLFIMYLGVLLCTCMFIMTECLDRWTPSLLSYDPH